MDWNLYIFQTGIQWLGSLAIAVITAVVTVRLSLQRFRTEKLWEKRLDAYVEVASGLNDMLHSLGRWLDEEMEGREFNPDYQAKLKERYESARRKLERIRGLSKLLLPLTIGEALEQAEAELNKRKEFYFQSLDDSYGALKVALDKVNSIGRIDLYSKKSDPLPLA